MQVSTGDLVIGDANGIVVVPVALVPEVARLAGACEARLDSWRRPRAKGARWRTRVQRPLGADVSAALLADFVVEFSDGERLSLPNGEPTVSVFQAARDAGIRLAHDCLGGTCGTCRGRVQGGHIAWLADTDALALSGKAAGEGGDEVLACQAHAQVGAHIVFPYPRASVLPQRKRRLRVTAKRRVGAAVWHVSCTSERPLEFLPGQYLRGNAAGLRGATRVLALHRAGRAHRRLFDPRAAAGRDVLLSARTRRGR